MIAHGDARNAALSGTTGRGRGREGPPLLIMREAAHLRACGASWEDVAKATGKSVDTLKKWPARFPQHWAQAMQGAGDAVRGMLAQEGAAALRRLVKVATSATSEQRCPRCSGTGWVTGMDKKRGDCPRCEGQGTVEAADQRLRKRADDTVTGLWRAVLPSQMDIGGAMGESLTFEQAMARLVAARKAGDNGGNGNGNGNGQGSAEPEDEDDWTW